MARSYTEDEWELMDIPRRLAYEQSNFDKPHIGQKARIKHAALLSRQTELQYRIRRSDVLDRWVMRKYRTSRFSDVRPPPEPFTAMRIDEVIQDRKIVDQG